MKDYYEEQTEKMSDEEKKDFKDYRTMECAEDDLRTLMRAEEVRKNEERFKKAMLMAKRKKSELEAIDR